MKISLVAKKDDGEVAEDAPTYHYSCCVINYTQSPVTAYSGVASEPSPEYDNTQFGRNFLKLKCLAVLQLLCGLVIVGVQFYPVYCVYYLDGLRDLTVHLMYYVYDGIMPGVWSGAVVALVGILGLIASRNASKGMVISYIFLNAIVLAFTLTLIVLSSLSTSEVINCKVDGAWARFDDDFHQPYQDQVYAYEAKLNEYNDLLLRQYDRDNRDRDSNEQWPCVTLPPRPTPPTTPQLVVLGENIHMKLDTCDTKFYCEHEMFTNWLLAEGVMILLSFVAMIVSVGAIVLCSRANCACCRSCCSGNVKRGEQSQALLSVAASHPGYVHM